MKKGLLLLAILFVFSVNAQKLSLRLRIKRIQQFTLLNILVKNSTMRIQRAQNGRVEFDGRKQVPEF